MNLLVACHDENKITKFFGACNHVKAELDKCFKMEKLQKSSENLVLDSSFYLNILR